MTNLSISRGHWTLHPDRLEYVELRREEIVLPQSDPLIVQIWEAYRTLSKSSVGGPEYIDGHYLSGEVYFVYEGIDETIMIKDLFMPLSYYGLSSNIALKVKSSVR